MPFPAPDPVDPRAREVLDFWFGPLPAVDAMPRDKAELWFTKKAETDEELSRRFAALRLEAVAGALTDWLDEPRGRLAAIILIDQFSRNLFRNSPGAFAHDPLARKWCLEGLERGMVEPLAYAEKLFFCIPLEHSEELAHQQRFLDLAEQWLREVPEGLREWAGSIRKYGQAHYDIVARFGRFPQRNAALGRESTDEEIAFLKTPGSSF